ncbi:MAG TPA: D-alanyl-D-alanine carboxypeptidase [Candidatus Aphodovivens avistercoris]|nr:D-alanyl-D-alanine carboxypeptidase [Candidatus Aphodovivens avistercoris]
MARLRPASAAHRAALPAATAAGRAALAVATSLLLCLALAAPAFAEVRRADVIMGQTVEERGLSVSQCPSIDALYACVMDDEGTVYFERDATSPTQIASVTKIMTALVALDAVGEGLVSLDDEVQVSAEAAAVGESTAGLQEGDVMTLEEALYGLLVPSGNDAAVAIAQTVGAVFAGTSADDDASQQAFIDQMNVTAADLGCVDTVYRNPHGLDDGEFAGDQHSCAADQALIVKEAMRDETFRAIVGGGDATIKVERDGEQVDIELASTDEFIDMYEHARGVKTGFTDLAGPSFAAAANDGERDLYAIVIHSSSEAQRFIDAQTLCEWVYGNMIDYALANSDEQVQASFGDVSGQVPVVAEVSHADWIDRTIPATLSDPDATAEVFALNGNVSQSFAFDEVHGAVSAGDKVGTATFKQRNEVIATYDLVACQDVPAPDFLTGVGIWWDRLFRSLSGQPTAAESTVLNATPLINDKTAVVQDAAAQQ